MYQQIPPYIDAFLQPIRDNPTAQTAIVAVLILTLMDVLFGLANAMFVQHDFESEKMRHGIGHKCVSFGFMMVADVVDGTLIGGLDLGYTSPVLVASCVYLCIMEIGSLMEIFAEIRPEVRDTPLWQLFAGVRPQEAGDA